MLHAEEETEWRKSPKQAELKMAAVQHNQRRYPASGDVYALQTSNSHCMQRISNQILKIILLYIMLNWPKILDAWKWGNYVQKAL